MKYIKLCHKVMMEVINERICYGNSISVCSNTRHRSSGKKALLPHQVGIKTIASSLCNHSEMRSFFGNDEPGYGYQYPMEPGEPGYEAIGIIEVIGAAVNTLKPGDGDYDNKRLSVIGLGAIGLCTVRLLHMFPTSDVTAFDLSLDKLKLAKDFGVDHTFLIEPDRNYDELDKFIGRFDVVIECSGHKSGQALAYTLCDKT
jgi:threonine dehydrogenase-like Zn-dependent dehydrogenase